MRPCRAGLLLALVLLLVSSSLIMNTRNSSAGSKSESASENITPNRKIAFAIHGGAGVINRNTLTPELERQYREKLEEALMAGYRVLENGGASLDAVETAIKIMEDSPLFNAGKGAVFTNAGTNELDASVMDGRTLKAGAVAGVKHIKNPITLARMVMERSPHVMMAGDGAEEFARQNGMQLVPQDYFFTQRRWDELKKKQEEERQRQSNPAGNGGGSRPNPFEHELGTVGAVALDSQGNLAAGTSTGGTTNKRFGRIGDSPIIGAGTYASNESCAVSATGDGEYFIRSVVAYDISALMSYKGKSAQDAADAVIAKVGRLGGTGGVIVLGKNGKIAVAFNSEGMYRGYVDADGKAVIEIYR
ncbi:MAG TPA: isoaspartyl peptidase/L-asparaginase [Pyrinomonadaceae bacterium]|nr:isoaspartyl peptidase/L-asparaginase [Pyrinomonadaceae bacterium]